MIITSQETTLTFESLKTTLGHGFESHHLHRTIAAGGGVMLPPAFCFQGLQFKITCHNYSLSVQLRDSPEKDARTPESNPHLTEIMQPQ